MAAAGGMDMQFLQLCKKGAGLGDNQKIIQQLKSQKLSRHGMSDQLKYVFKPQNMELWGMKVSTDPSICGLVGPKLSHFDQPF